MTLLQAQCAEHPILSAVEVCSRCGKFLCGDCVELVRAAPYCRACRSRAIRTHVSAIEVVAIGIGAAGLVVPLLGVAALIAGAIMSRNPTRPWGKVVRNLGVVGTVIWGMILAGLFREIVTLVEAIRG